MPVDRLRRFLWPALLLGLAGCASTGAPPGWLPVADDAPREAYGAWINVEFGSRMQRPPLAGEFLAVGPDSIYVLPYESRRAMPVTAVGKDDIRRAQIAWFDPEAGRAGGWVAMGTLLSVSNGFIAVITWPLWWIGGGIMAGSQSRLPLEDWPHDRWDELAAYARFPQGLPPHLQGGVLLGKPRWFHPVKQPLTRRSESDIPEF